MKYQYGIIAYMNGAEIYRDNMPEGSVTSTTAALGGYSSLQYHGVIRSGLEVTSGQQIVAIELHYTSSMTQADLNMVMWMAQYASSYNQANTMNCYAVPYEPIITTTDGNNEDNAIDYNKSSYWSIPNFMPSQSITYSYQQLSMNVNGISLFPSIYPSYSPSDFTPLPTLMEATALS